MTERNFTEEFYEDLAEKINSEYPNIIETLPSFRFVSRELGVGKHSVLGSVKYSYHENLEILSIAFHYKKIELDMKWVDIDQEDYENFGEFIAQYYAEMKQG